MNDAPLILEIAHGSADYHKVVQWRDKVLRRPLGLELTAADVAGEEAQRHFVLRKGREIQAGVIAVPAVAGVVRLRQMWVRDDMSGQGFGRALLEGVEAILRGEGYKLVVLNARLAVRGFYRNCGYLAEGPEFEEVGIPHIVMSRPLASM